MTELRITAGAEETAEIALNRLLSAGKTGSAALSFGSTYTEIFRIWKRLLSPNLLSPNLPAETIGARAARAGLPAFFPADERLVGFDDRRSNWGAAVRLFLSDYGAGEDLNRFAPDLETYRKILRDFFSARPPVFDIIFLGLGPDGHTASLFPGSCPDVNSKPWFEPVLETTAPFDPPGRLTLGPELIASAKQLVMTVTGKNKADIFRTFISQLEPSGPEGTPAKELPPAEALPPVKILNRRRVLGLNTLILADREAAEKLPETMKKGHTL